jgi:hypothetical protein
VRLYLPNKMTCLVDLCSTLIRCKGFPQGRGHLRICLLIYFGVRGSVVVKALCYKPEGIRFETLLGECIFFNLPNLSGRTRPWGLFSFQQK